MKKPCKIPRTNSLSPNIEGQNKAPRSTPWTIEDTDSVSDICLESPMHALASANEIEGENAPLCGVNEQSMCQFTSLFEDDVDIGIEESKFMLLEHDNAHFGIDSDASSVPSICKSFLVFILHPWTKLIS